MSRKTVCDGTIGALTEEVGVELRLRDCLPSRPLDLLFPTSGGMLIVRGQRPEEVKIDGGMLVKNAI